MVHKKKLAPNETTPIQEGSIVPLFTPAAPQINPISEQAQNTMFPKGTQLIFSSNSFVTQNVGTNDNTIYTVPNLKAFILVGGTIEYQHVGDTAVPSSGDVQVRIVQQTYAYPYISRASTVQAFKDLDNQPLVESYDQSFSPHIPLVLQAGTNIVMHSNVNNAGYIKFTYFLYGYEIDI